ncbi:MAG: ATP-binding cassette domain-containing protein [Clostridia bacterium]
MLELKNLTKKYGEKTIFQDANFVFPDKGLVVLMGSSGAGKSTLFHLIGGADRDFDGKIIYNNFDISQLDDSKMQNFKRDCIGNIFQNYTLIKGYTARQNLQVADFLRENSDSSLACDLLAKVGLGAKADQKVDTMSGGEKQRVAIARALSYNPSILLADEPTGALDEKNTAAIMELLSELARDILVIVITHNEDLRKFADVNLVIKGKQIVVDIDKKAKYRKSYAEKQNVNTACDNKKVNENCSQNGKLAPQNIQNIDTKRNENDGKVDDISAHNSTTCPTYEPTSARDSQFDFSSAMRLACQNYKVWFGKLIVIILLTSFALIACFSSLFARKAVENNMQDFLDKNSAYDNMQIFTRDYDQQLFDKMTSDKRLQDVFYRFDIMYSGVKIGDKEVEIFRKSPTANSNLVFASGRLPANNKQIAISPSLAKKITPNIKDVLGKKITFYYKDKDGAKHFFDQEICGVFNSNYDDYAIDSEIEREIYAHSDNEKPIGISSKIVSQDIIVDISNEYSQQNYKVFSCAEELTMLDKNFQTIKLVFLIMSIIVFVAAIVGSGILAKKYLQIRLADKKILTDLGYSKQNISSITACESALVGGTILAITAIVVVTILLCI